MVEVCKYQVIDATSQAPAGGSSLAQGSPTQYKAETLLPKYRDQRVREFRR